MTPVAHLLLQLVALGFAGLGVLDAHAHRLVPHQAIVDGNGQVAVDGEVPDQETPVALPGAVHALGARNRFVEHLDVDVQAAQHHAGSRLQDRLPDDPVGEPSMQRDERQHAPEQRGTKSNPGRVDQERKRCTQRSRYDWGQPLSGGQALVIQNLLHANGLPHNSTPLHNEWQCSSSPTNAPEPVHQVSAMPYQLLMHGVSKGRNHCSSVITNSHHDIFVDNRKNSVDAADD